MRDDARLARARAGENQHGAVGLQHRLALLGVQSGCEIHFPRDTRAQNPRRCQVGNESPRDRSWFDTLTTNGAAATVRPELVEGEQLPYSTVTLFARLRG